MLRDVLLALAGVPGDLVVVAAAASPAADVDAAIGERLVLIDDAPLVHPGERAMIAMLLEVGTWYRRTMALIRSTLARTANAGTNERDASLLQQAAVLTVDRLLQEYRDALVVVEAAALREGSTPLGIVLDSIVPHRPRLAALASWMSEMTAERLRGGELLSRLRERAESGAPAVEHVFRCVWAACWTVYLRKLTPWILFGELSATGEAEFFLKAPNRSPTSAAPHDGLAPGTRSSSSNPNVGGSGGGQAEVDRVNVPSFVSATQVTAMVFCGQATPVLRRSTAVDAAARATLDTVWMQLQARAIAAASGADGPTMGVSALLRAFDVAVQQSFAFASKDMLTLLRGEGQLVAHLRAIRQYCLLGRGDLVTEFITLVEHAQPTLSAARAQFDLGVLLRRARERTSAQSDAMFDDVALRLYDGANAVGTFAGAPLAIAYLPPWPVVHLLSTGVMERYVRLSQMLLALARTAWHVDVLWLPQTHAARQRTGVQGAQRAALSAYLAGWQSYLQMDVIEPAFVTLEAAVASAGTFHELAAAHSEYIAVLTEAALLDHPTLLKTFDESLRASYQFARRLERTLATAEAGAVQPTAGSVAETGSSYEAFLAAATELVGALAAVEEQPETAHIARLRSRIDYSGFYSTSRRV